MPSTLQLIKSDLKRKQEIFHQDGAEISLFRTCLTDGTSANILFRLAARCAKTKILAPIALIRLGVKSAGAIWYCSGRMTTVDLSHLKL